jgi:hypothetical protein
MYGTNLDKAKLVRRKALPKIGPHLQKLIEEKNKKELVEGAKEQLSQWLQSISHQELMDMHRQLDLPLADLKKNLGPQQFERLINNIKVKKMGKEFLATSHTENAVTIIRLVHGLAATVLGFGTTIIQIAFPKQGGETTGFFSVGIYLVGTITAIVLAREFNIMALQQREVDSFQEIQIYTLRLQILNTLRAKQEELIITQHLSAIVDKLTALRDYCEPQVKQIMELTLKSDPTDGCFDIQSLITEIENIVHKLNLDDAIKKILLPINGSTKELKKYVTPKQSEPTDEAVTISAAVAEAEQKLVVAEQKISVDVEKMQELKFFRWCKTHKGFVAYMMLFDTVAIGGANFTFPGTVQVIGDYFRPGVVSDWLNTKLGLAVTVIPNVVLSLGLAGLGLYAAFLRERRKTYLSTTRNNVAEAIEQVTLAERDIGIMRNIELQLSLAINSILLELAKKADSKKAASLELKLAPTPASGTIVRDIVARLEIKNAVPADPDPSLPLLQAAVASAQAAATVAAAVAEKKGRDNNSAQVLIKSTAGGTTTVTRFPTPAVATPKPPAKKDTQPNTVVADNPKQPLLSQPSRTISCAML